MLFDDILPRVLPYTPNCPPQTALLHLIDAAKTFCRRTRAWNVQGAAIPTVANQAAYTLTLPAGSEIVRLLACEVQGGTEYDTAVGSAGRKALRDHNGNVALLTPPATITLDPAPVLAGQNLLVDYCLMPTDAATEWPDTLLEHVEFLAAGAIASLCAMPKKSTDWHDADTAAEQGAKFERRINATYHATARTFQAYARAKQPVIF